MKENGLEWLYRLKTEPRRLWRRYLVGGSEFALRLLVAISTGEFRIRKPILERTGTS
jgi:UDP-N-acetyl-D-mannosaminuronic acid transferase (WecB/TagA/CpsF family)